MGHIRIGRDLIKGVLGDCIMCYLLVCQQLNGGQMKPFRISQKGPGGWPHKGHVWMGVCILLACFAFAGVVSGAANLITGPSVISVPGTYILANDITNSNAPICIQITAPNVVLDGKGYSIDGIDGSNSIGIKVYNSAMTLFNVIIKNLDISDWGTGVLLQNVKNSQLTECECNEQYRKWDCAPKCIEKCSNFLHRIFQWRRWDYFVFIQRFQYPHREHSAGERVGRDPDTALEQ